VPATGVRTPGAGTLGGEGDEGLLERIRERRRADEEAMELQRGGKGGIRFTTGEGENKERGDLPHLPSSSRWPKRLQALHRMGSRQSRTW
jgi:hypothetical protein